MVLGTPNLKGTLNGTSASDTLYAQRDYEYISDIYSNVNGLDGNHTIFSAFDNWETSGYTTNSSFLFWLLGGSGNDVIYGGPSSEFISGDSDSDWLAGGLGDDWLEGGEGDDFILTGPVGYGDKNVVIGGEGNDIFYLGGGNAPSTTNNSFSATDTALAVLSVVGSVVPAVGFAASVVSLIFDVIGGSSTTPMISKYADDYVKVGDFDPSEDMVILPISSDADFSVEYQEIKSADDADLGSGLSGLKISAGNNSTIANLFGDQFKSHESLWEQVMNNRISIRKDLQGNNQIYQASTGKEISEDELLASFGDEAADVFQDLNKGDSVIILGAYGSQNLEGDADENELLGTVYDDTLTGGADNDTLDGGSGVDTVAYSSSTSAVNVRLWQETASNDGFGNTDTLLNIENIIGSEYNDVLAGDSGANTFVGGDGSDTLYGGNGTDTVDYSSSTNAVNVSLWQETASDDGFGNTDKLWDIENVIGSEYNDVLAGNSGANTFVGGDGKDTLSGGNGTDTVDYSSSTSGVKVSLWQETASNDGFGNTDTLWNIENVIGSEYNDVLAGNSGANKLEGGSGVDEIYGGADDDILIGGSSYDYIDGGSGNDTVDYSSSTSRVWVGLGNEKATDDGLGANDKLVNIENIVGSSYNDLLTGSEADNLINGGNGNDVIYSSAGNDTFTGGQGRDVFLFYSSDGTDTITDFVSGEDQIQIVKSGFGLGSVPDSVALSTVQIVNVGGENPYLLGVAGQEVAYFNTAISVGNISLLG